MVDYIFNLRRKYFNKNEYLINELFYVKLNELKIQLDSEEKKYIIKRAISKYQSLKNKWKRIKNRIDLMNNPYFITFTLSDESLKNITKETLIRYIKERLIQFESYIINVDYSPEKKRLHFHAVVDGVIDGEIVIITKDLINWYKYGFIDIKRCYSTINKYLCKLTNHALKIERKEFRNELYYSRKKRLGHIPSLDEFKNRKIGRPRKKVLNEN